MGKKLGLPSLILTIVLVIGSVWVYYDLMVLKTDYGAHNDAVRLLGIALFVLTVVMVAGCYAVYAGFSQTDLESMAPK